MKTICLKIGDWYKLQEVDDWIIRSGTVEIEFEKKKTPMDFSDVPEGSKRYVLSSAYFHATGNYRGGYQVFEAE